MLKMEQDLRTIWLRKWCQDTNITKKQIYSVQAALCLNLYMDEFPSIRNPKRVYLGISFLIQLLDL